MVGVGWESVVLLLTGWEEIRSTGPSLAQCLTRLLVKAVGVSRVGQEIGWLPQLVHPWQQWQNVLREQVFDAVDDLQLLLSRRVRHLAIGQDEGAAATPVRS